MPLTEEDEIFVEKCVQRSVIVSVANTAVVPRLITRIQSTGIKQAHLVQWDSHRRLAENGGDLSRGTRILHAHRME